MTVTIRNDGSATWRAEQDFSVAYHWLRPNGETADWEGVRTPMPHPVAPGETVRLEATVLPPNQPGSYTLQWDLVREHVCWFSDKGRDPTPEQPVPVEARLNVTHAMTVLSHQVPGWMWTGSAHQIAVTLRNDGTGRLFEAEFWADAARLLASTGAELWVGGLVCGLVVAPPTYFATRWAINAVRHLREARRLSHGPMDP